MIKKILFWFVVVMVAVWFLTPVIMIVIASLTPSSEYYNPNKIFPSHLTFEHIYKLLFVLGGWKATLISIEVALVAIGLSFLIGLPAGYAMTRYFFPGKNAIRIGILMTRSIPLIVIAVPLIVLCMEIDIVDTGMVVYECR